MRRQCLDFFNADDGRHSWTYRYGMDKDRVMEDVSRLEFGGQSSRRPEQNHKFQIPNYKQITMTKIQNSKHDYTYFGLHSRKGCDPSSKKHEIFNTQEFRPAEFFLVSGRFRSLVIGIWNLFDIWCLEFGIYTFCIHYASISLIHFICAGRSHLSLIRFKGHRFLSLNISKQL